MRTINNRLTGWGGRLLAGLLVTGAVGHAEMRMDVNGGAKIYQNRALAAELDAGEVVETREYAENEDWLWAKRGEGIYLVRRDDVKSLVDLETDYAVFVEEAQAELKTVKRDLMVGLTQRQQLAEAIRLVQFDELLYFRTSSPKLTVINSTNGGDPAVALSQRYRYDGLISSAQSGRLQRDWREDLETVNDDLAGLWRKRLSIESELGRREAEMQTARSRFDAFGNGDPHYRAVPYVVSARSTTLYQNRAAGERLSRGDIVYAWPNGRYRGWLDTVIEGKVFQVDGRHLQNASELEAGFKRDLINDTLRAAQLESDIEFARFLEDLLGRLSLQLEFGTRGGDYVLIPRFGPNVPRNRLHAIDHDANAVVVYRRGSGRRTLAEWEEDQDALADQRKAMQEQLRELKGRVIRTEAELSKLRRVLGKEQGE